MLFSDQWSDLLPAYCRRVSRVVFRPVVGNVARVLRSQRWDNSRPCGREQLAEPISDQRSELVPVARHV